MSPFVATSVRLATTRLRAFALVGSVRSARVLLLRPLRRDVVAERLPPPLRRSQRPKHQRQPTGVFVVVAVPPSLLWKLRSRTYRLPR
jgi:hypothetical protein